jgi:hypothetical protein
MHEGRKTISIDVNNKVKNFRKIVSILLIGVFFLIVLVVVRNLYYQNPYPKNSGHYAGYAWAGKECSGNSQSFIEGCEKMKEKNNVLLFLAAISLCVFSYGLGFRHGDQY